MLSASTLEPAHMSSAPTLAKDAGTGETYRRKTRLASRGTVGGSESAWRLSEEAEPHLLYFGTTAVQVGKMFIRVANDTINLRNGEYKLFLAIATATGSGARLDDLPAVIGLESSKRSIAVVRTNIYNLRKKIHALGLFKLSTNTHRSAISYTLDAL
jgi:DNA-binding response OmpR family regulator